MCTQNNATAACNIKVVDPTFVAPVATSEPFHMTKALMGEPVKTIDNRYEARVKYALGKHYGGSETQVLTVDLYANGARHSGERKFTLQGKALSGDLQLCMGVCAVETTKRWVNVRVTKSNKIFIGTQLHQSEAKAKQAALRGNTKTLATVAVEINPNRTTVEGLTIVM